MRVIRGCDGTVISEHYNSNGVSTTATLNNATGSLIYGGGDGIFVLLHQHAVGKEMILRRRELGFVENKENESVCRAKIMRDKTSLR